MTSKRRSLSPFVPEMLRPSYGSSVGLFVLLRLLYVGGSRDVQ